MICKHNSVTKIDLVFHTHDMEFNPESLDLRSILYRLPDHYEHTSLNLKTKISSGNVIKSVFNDKNATLEHEIFLSKTKQYKIMTFPTQDSKVAPYTSKPSFRYNIHSCKSE